VKIIIEKYMARKRNRKSKKKTTKVVVSNGRTGGNKKQLNKFAELVCAVTDPFCEAAKNAKWFGQGSVPTVVYQKKTRVKLTTGSGGNANFLWIPTVDKYDSFTTGNNNITPNTDLPTSTDARWATSLDNGEVAAARVVSAGAYWYDVSAATANGGTVTVQTMDGGAGIAPLAATSINPGIPNYSNDVQMYDRRAGGTWVSKACNETSYKFEAPQLAATWSSPSQYQRTALMLSASGTISSQVLEIILITNIECELVGTSLMTATASRVPQPLANNRIRDAANSVENSMVSSFKGNNFARVTDFVKKGVYQALGFVGGAVSAGITNAVSMRLSGMPYMGGGQNYIMDVD
jgi:hypothetical protein